MKGSRCGSGPWTLRATDGARPERAAARGGGRGLRPLRFWPPRSPLRRRRRRAGGTTAGITAAKEPHGLRSGPCWRSSPSRTPTRRGSFIRPATTAGTRTAIARTTMERTGIARRIASVTATTARTGTATDIATGDTGTCTAARPRPRSCSRTGTGTGPEPGTCIHSTARARSIATDRAPPPPRARTGPRSRRRERRTHDFRRSDPRSVPGEDRGDRCPPGYPRVARVRGFRLRTARGSGPVAVRRVVSGRRRPCRPC